MINPTFEKTRLNPADVLDQLGIVVTFKFVPFSQSRNKDSDSLTLNWRVGIVCNGYDVLTTDYSAGIAHCPSYNKKPHVGFSGSDSIYQRIVTRAECETGRPVKRVLANDTCLFDNKRIEPNPVDVLYSIVMDSSVLDSGGFENQACEFGYDTDSRRAESTYDACLEIALQMRAGIGANGMEMLQKAFEDY